MHPPGIVVIGGEEGTSAEDVSPSGSRKGGGIDPSKHKNRKRKPRKKDPASVVIKQEIAVLRSKVGGGTESEGLLKEMETLLEKLLQKEPSLGKELSGSRRVSAAATAAIATAATASDYSKHPALQSAALKRLCKAWVRRREALRQPEARAVRDRMRVWDAFIASEKSYFLTLLTMVQKCMKPIQQAAPSVTDETLQELFGSLPDIKDNSKNLLSKLRTGANGAQWIPSTTIGNLFQHDLLPMMSKTYVLYVVEYPKRVQALSRLIRKFPEVRGVIDRSFLEGSQTLAEMLLAPMHRMSAYEWTLQELLRLTPTDHVCREAMQQAVMGVTQLNMLLVMQKKQASRAQILADAGDIHPQLLQLQVDAIGGSLGATLDGRQFVRDGPVFVLHQDGSADRRHLYLFSDCLAVGTPKAAGIQFDENLILRTCQLTDSDEAEMARFVFELSGTGEVGLGQGRKVIRFSCNTQEEKKSWMNDINSAINTVTSVKQLAIATGGQALSTVDLDKINANMRHPATGVPVKTHKRRLQVFADSFVGSDAVDWLARNYSLPRRAAVEVGQRLLDAHYFHHVAYDRTFEDKKELYEFQELGEGSPKVPEGINWAELVKKMFHAGAGIALGQKKGRFAVAKKNSFAGSDMVDWLHKNLKVQRHVAITIGQYLLDDGTYFTANKSGDVFADDKDRFYVMKSDTLEDLSFPTERVLKALRELKASPQFKGSGEDLDYVIRMLTSGGNMYTSNLRSMLDQQDDLDQDTKKLVLSYAGDNQSVVKKKILERALHSVNTSLVASDDSSSRSPLINALVARVGEWDYPCFQLDEESNHTPLYAMGYAMFVAHGLISKFNIEEKKLSNFLKLMNDGYRKNHYHNAIHAADVTQTVNYFLKTGPMSQAPLSDAELFAVVLAAIIHDFDHPGYNNAFMINSKSDIAIRYNDMSVLENHHLAASFAIMRNDDCNIFSNCTDDVYKEVRQTTIQCVLATDFGKHFDLLGQFKGKVAGGGLDLESKPEDRRLVLQLALKAADISHTSKSLETHRRWTESITEEFYSQGDEERARNLPPSPFMDRSTGNLPKSQVGFIGFLVMPLYETWCDVFEESTPALEGLQRNLAYWKDLAEPTTGGPAK